MLKRILSLAFASLTTLCQAELLHSYRFDGNLLPSAGVFNLQGCQGLANPTLDFVPTYVTDTVGANTKQVAQFGASGDNQGFLARLGMYPETGYSYGNAYTLMWDIKVEAFRDGRWLSFYNTNATNSNDGDMFLDVTRGWGVSGDYAGIGSFQPSTWHRVVMTVNLFRAGTSVDPRMNIYVDGVLVNQVNLGSGLDGCWALYTESDGFFKGTWLLMDESGESARGALSQVAFWNEELSPTAVAGLGPVGTNVGANPVGVASVTILEGEEAYGNLGSLASSDDDSYCLFNDSASLGASIEVASEPVSSASSLAFSMETSAGRLGLQQVVKFLNAVTGQWETKVGLVAPTEDRMVRAYAGANASDYVGLSGQVKVRVQWSPINDEAPAVDGWLHCLDVAKFELLP